VTGAEQLRSQAEQWLAAEPDEDIRAELRALLDGPAEDLAARFGGRLMFGTAGLRAAIGAGPLRMNRLVVRHAARGLAHHVLDVDQAAATRGVVIGFDARHKSDVFAEDSARVMAAAGMRVHVLPVALPTPVLAWAVTELGCAAGVMVTASHNPPADNGYKVYLGDGAQIVPPHDMAIADRIAAVDPTTVAMADGRDPRIARLPHSFVDGYVDGMRAVRMRPASTGVAVAYTPLHGVGGEIALRAFEAAGLPEPYVVAEQAEPDPAFPTVAFPNPEEPGAMDLVIALAAETGAALALANDPDADRLGAAIPQPDGTWRRLGGDEVGWLLADHLLTNTAPGPRGEDRLVVTTLVSSSLLATMAADYGVHFAETFTGFKWMARAALERPHLRLLFAYEQALGYLVTSRPLDKDGISAAVVLAEVAAVAAAERTTIQARLDDIAARYGRHVVGERALRMAPDEGAAAVRQLQADPPTELADVRVADVRAFPEAGLLRLVLEGGIRVQARPSGTEPKVKLYGEAVDADPGPYLDALAALLQPH
jgi:phosphomannomutase